MSKRNKRTMRQAIAYISEREGSSCPFNPPETVGCDTLAAMGDEELNRRGRELEGMRRRVEEAGHDVTPWDVELCWLDREIEVRSRRKMAHEAYAARDRAAWLDEESFWPEVSFDQFRWSDMCLRIESIRKRHGRRDDP